jgi:putative ABC transport system ATP-binding protein
MIAPEIHRSSLATQEVDAMNDPMHDPILRAHGVHKWFGQTEALRGVDIDIQRGEVLAIMGPSGSGKSTLLHCLAGVMVPEEGTVILGDMVISAMNEGQRSALRLSTLGFVFQFGQLLPELNAVDNVCIPLLLGGARRKDAIRQAAEFLALLGLGDALTKLPTELSGGEAQRVAVARAMVSEPKLLFADEPTGSLDSFAAENVLNAMLDLVREMKTTVVIITHDPRTAAYADREVIVRDGRISASPFGVRA